MATYKAPGRCSVCGGTLHVTKLSCDTCGSELTGNFTPCRFCALDPAQLAFLEIFIKNRGNIKDIERERGISYPTVRNNLDNLLSALGYGAASAPAERMTKKEILAKLEKKEITAQEAIALLEELEGE